MTVIQRFKFLLTLLDVSISYHLSFLDFIFQTFHMPSYLFVFYLTEFFFILVNYLFVYCRHHLSSLALSAWIFNGLQVLLWILLLFCFDCLPFILKLFVLFLPNYKQFLSIAISRPNGSVWYWSSIRSGRLVTSAADSTMIVPEGLPSHSIFLWSEALSPFLFLLIYSFLFEESIKILLVIADDFLMVI